jgi:hypothetical protein
VVDRILDGLVEAFLVHRSVQYEVREAHPVHHFHLEALHFLSQQHPLFGGHRQFLKFALLQLFLNEEFSRHEEVAAFGKQVVAEVEFDAGIGVFGEELEDTEGVGLADEEEQVLELEDGERLVDEERVVVEVRE